FDQLRRHPTASRIVSRSRPWLALKARIEQRVTLAPSPLQLAGRDLLWYRVTDGDRLLQSAVSNPQRPAEELDPFWAATWRAAQGLDRWLGNYNLRGIRLLELGCGSGQAGVGAAYRGAQVTMTDAVGMALLVARLNAWAIRRQIRLRRLKWGEQTLPTANFPLIIGSDLVYDPQLFSRLDRCARQHLAPGGRLLLSEPHRHTGDHFAGWIRAAGWNTRQHDVDLEDGRVAIRIFECWR
ncbi:MAG: methyltransferase domain-containing protein, partial [Planctomycetales bacterium]|nr:methyltransferase domain-containing protein [Planctomycetales bacterium]